MAQINKYVPLKEIVLSYSEAAKKSDSEFLRLWRIAFRGFKQMGINAFWQSKQVSLPVNPNLTVTLPNDYLQWIRVGNFNANGELKILDVNNSLSTFGDLSNDRLNKIASQVSLLEPILLNSIDYYQTDVADSGYSYNSPKYGLGSRLLTVGKCKVDEKNRVILLDVNFPYSEIVLEYISSPEDDVDYEIPYEFEEAMIAWLAWQDKLYVPATSKGGAVEKQILAKNFADQLKLAKKTFKPIRIMEIELYFRNAMKYAVKG